MTTGNFSATVSRWVQKTKGAPIAVFRESTQRFVNLMQKPEAAGGRMPVDTGFLRSSLQGSKTQLNLRLKSGDPEGNYNYQPQQITLVIGSINSGETLYLAYGAVYAMPQEFGGNGRRPKAFVRGAAAEWQRIVSEVSREAEARYSGI